MKQGMPLQQLAEELERRRKAKQDFLADTRALTMDDTARIALANMPAMEITEFASRQLASKLDIPFTYYDRLRTKHPRLLAENVNTLFQREPQQNMIRLLDGKVRAILSSSYRPLDNDSLANAVLPVLIANQAEVESCDITETKFYIKATMPKLTVELPVPEGLKMGAGHNWFVRSVTAGISIMNSEVGDGSLSILPAVFERQCTNYAVFKDASYRKIHVGERKQLSDINVQEYLSDKTKELNDAAVWSTVHDLTIASLNGKLFNDIVAQLRQAREDGITANPVQLVEVFSKREHLNEDESGSVLRHLINGGELTRYGLQWAVTRAAEDATTYDRASQLERLGGRIIELGRDQWQELQKAA